ncbi:MAG: NAD-dependent epimerase/dehydratase family protein [Bacteroidales bacterium]|nr:NAD-dependent epimerase/dehydratase family protein [Candidatus Liminaster caballi]
MTSYSEDIRRAAAAALPWERLSGCNILVTGATGLIGGCLVEVLMAHADSTCHVYASGRNEASAMKRFAGYADDPRFHFVRYDVLEPLQSDVNFHYIIHAASNASPNFFAQSPVEIIKANVIGTCNLIEYGMSHGMRRMLYVSSGEVYGEGDGRTFDEAYSGYVDCSQPRSCYPSSKRAAETLCASYVSEYGADIVMARPSHTYGPHFTSADNRVYAQFIRNVLNGEDIVMKSTGSQYRSWCYVVDCALAMLCILLKGECGKPYNIADATSNITIRELAEMIASIGNRKVVIDLPSDVERRGFNPVTRSLFSTERLQSLGWEPLEGTMTDKMRHTIEALA